MGSAWLSVASIVLLELLKWWIGPVFASGFALGGIAMAIVAFWEVGANKRAADIAASDRADGR